MKAIILAAGYTTRSYPVTNGMAKPLLTIRGKPVIEHLVSRVQFLELVDEIIIVTNDKFYDRFNAWRDNFVEIVPIRVINDGSLNHKDSLGPMGDLLVAMKVCSIDDDLLVIGGDNVFTFPLNDFVGSTTLTPDRNLIGVCHLSFNHDPSKFGIVKMDDDNKVVDFIEKPKDANGSPWVSTCLYYFPKSKLSMIDEYLKKDGACRGTGDYIHWLTQHDSVYAYAFDGTWLDIGDIDAYAEAVLTL